MKKTFTILFLVFICCSNSATAQAPNWLWADGAGGSSNDQGNCVYSDANGDVYIIGTFNSPSITFGTITLTNSGGNDVFIAKYDSYGNLMWAKSAGGSGDDQGYGVTTDVSGNVIITGAFGSSTITFGTTTLINAGNYYNIFIVKYDLNGTMIWAKSAGGSNGDAGHSVTSDLKGNIYLTGWFFSSSLTFGTTTLSNIGNADVFLAKYDSAGNALWAKSAGGFSSDKANSVAVDVNGNVFIAGDFSSTAISFGTTTLMANSSGGGDIFIAKYDSSGTAIWAKSAGSNSLERCFSVSADTSGNAFITGFFQSTHITFGTTTLTNAGVTNIYIVKYDPNGNVVWAKSQGGTAYNEGYSVVSDVSGNVFMAGSFYSPSLIFGTTTLTNAGVYDIFIVKYDPNGNAIWAKSSGGTIIDNCYGVTINVTGTVFLTGSYSSANMHFGTISISNSAGAGSNDIFIAKLNGNYVNVEELLEPSDILIAPNPFNSETTIVFRKEQNNTTIKIIDVLGNEIKTTSFSGKQVVFDKGEMKPGIYFVQAIDENRNVANRKIVIQ